MASELRSSPRHADGRLQCLPLLGFHGEDGPRRLSLGMLDRLVHIGLWASLGTTVVVMLVNAFYMVVSPKTWFRLPRWLGLQGVLTPERYSSSWGGLQVRILGMIIIGTAGWITYELLASLAGK